MVIRSNVKSFFSCNGYLGNLEPKISKKVMPINNFILATEILKNLLDSFLKIIMQ